MNLSSIRFRHWTVLFTLFVLALGAAAAQDKESRALDLRREEQRSRFLADQPEPDLGAQWAGATPCVDGMAGVYPCNKIDLLTFIPNSQIGGGNANDIWGWTDPLTGREYAIMGRTSGTSFVDVTDPINPIYVGNLPKHTSNSTWRDIKVYANHAYIVSEASSHGMQVFDLTQLRTATPGSTFGETAHYDDFGSAHNLAINEDTGYGYAVGTATCSGGPHFIDLQNPTAPVFAGCHPEPIYTHDTQCVIYAGPDPDHQGRELCFNSNENKFNIIDVTDKANSTLISTTNYSGASYTHQGWLTEDQVYWLQGDELDEQSQGHNTRTRIFDVSNLDDPELIGIYDGPTAAIDHNLYTHQGYAYEANYRAGLRILDLVDVGSGVLTEVAYFDTYPSSNAPEFSGLWSVYPYFPSGTVVVSGIGEGMFILRPTLQSDFDLELDDSVLSVCDPGESTTGVTLTERNGYSGDVTLSALGLPPGASASFSVNPVTVPGTSDMTITTSGLAPGNYPFTVSGTDGTLTHEQPLQLDVANAVAGQPVLLSPANGAVGVSRTPALEWSAVPQASSYQVELATDPGFGFIVFGASVDDTSVTLTGSNLDPDTTYYWRVRGGNGCGVGPDSEVFSFTTLTVPPVLLVDDDDNSPDVRDAYTAALVALGEDHDVWDTGNTDDEPSAATLDAYQVVIWFTGDEFGGAAGPGPGGESALEDWLDSSRCLLMIGQDYYYDRGLTGLIQNYLGVAAADNDVGHTTVTGLGSVFSGLGPYVMDFPYSNFTDDLTPDATAEGAFEGTSGSIDAFAGIHKDAGVYRTSFWSFGLETLPAAEGRESVLSAFLGWCAALDGDSDGVPNDEDCAPGNPDAWAIPTPARNLRVGTSFLQWEAPVDPGGSPVLYDVLRSGDPSEFGSASCIEPGQTDPLAIDTGAPEPNELYCYLVRAHNDCGGTLGVDSQSTPRVGTACP